MIIEAKVCGWTKVSFCFVFLAKNSYVARKAAEKAIADAVLLSNKNLLTWRQSHLTCWNY